MISLVRFDITWTAAGPPDTRRQRAGARHPESVIDNDKTPPNLADATFGATHKAAARHAR